MSETVTYILPYKLGGVTTWVKALLAHRAPDLFSYHAIFTDNTRDRDTRSDDVLRADSVQRFAHDLPGENVHAVARRLARMLPQGGGVIVANDWLPLAMASVCDTGKMLVNITHGDFEYYYGLVTLHAPVIDCFAAITPVIYQRLLELLPERRDSIFLLSSGISIPEVARAPVAGPIRLLYVGRLHRDKGIFDLPKIDRILAEQGVPHSWTVQGTGPDEAALKEAWRGPAIRWTGRQPYESVLELYRSHDVLVMPSRSEGLPMALMEATAAGVVPVVSDLATGFPDLVHNGATGFRCPVGDVKAFADAISLLAANREKLEEMSSNVRALCCRNYKIEDRVRGYQELYARWRELKRPRPARFAMQYGSRLDKPWIPNALVKMLRSYTLRNRQSGSG